MRKPCCQSVGHRVNPAYWPLAGNRNCNMTRKICRRQAMVRTGHFFCNFGHRIFGTFRVEASVIMRRHEVAYRVSSDPKMLDLE